MQFASWLFQARGLGGVDGAAADGCRGLVRVQGVESRSGGSHHSIRPISAGRTPEEADTVRACSACRESLNISCSNETKPRDEWRRALLPRNSSRVAHYA